MARLVVLGMLGASHPFAVFAAAPFTLELFPKELAEERGAQCLDHSPAGYYIRVQDPQHWVVFLEGGGLCVETVDCIIRAVDSPTGSSKYWHNHTTPENNHMLTEDSPLNPFANWSHVYLPYCSGDTWLGNSKGPHLTLLGLQMSGHLILETALERLANTTAFAKATEVVLGGTSAGGIGTFHHADWFAEKVGQLAAAAGATAPRVAAFPVEGIFFPAKFPVLYPEFAVGLRQPVDDFFSDWVTGVFSPTWMHAGCLQGAKTKDFEEAHCFDISVMFEYIETPIFVLTNQFDKLMIHDMGICLSCDVKSTPTSTAGNYMRFFGQLMNQTLAHFHAARPSAGIFATSEYHHDENFNGLFRDHEKKISGVSLRSAIERWYFHGETTVLLEATCGDAAHPMPCPREATSGTGGFEGAASLRDPLVF